MSHETTVAPSADVKDILVAASIGVFAATKGWAIYIGNQPDKPNNVITIADTDVRSTTHLINKIGTDAAETRVEYPGIQIRVRSPQYVDAYSKINEVINALANIEKFTASGFEYLSIYIQGGILPLGEDEKARNIFSANFMVTSFMI